MMFKCSLQYNQQTQDVPFGKMTFFEALYVDCQISDITLPNGKCKGKRFQITIHPKQDIHFQNLEIQYAYPFQKTDTVFCNGYQSWSESREHPIESSIPALRSFATSYIGNYGDDTMPTIPRGNGIFHSWTYTYIRQQNGLQFIGSLSEQAAFTLIAMDTPQGIIRIQKDISDLKLTHSLPLLDVVLLEGTEQSVFDAYFNLMEKAVPIVKPAFFWTTAIHQTVTESFVLAQTDAFLTTQPRQTDAYDIIIDIANGYQTQVGDWLEVRPDFSENIAQLVQKIQQKDCLASLWLAPFVCDFNSKIAQQHPDWLLKDQHGKRLQTKFPNQSQRLYVLDFYHQGVQEYLTRILLIILQKWNFDVVHLDLLYVACLVPRSHQSRGKVLYDALQFIRNLVGEKRIWVDGVPLGSCFGQVEYAGISPQTIMRWTHPIHRFLRHRERHSAMSALQTTLGRWQLDGRAFRSTPALFTLQASEHPFTYTQQHTLLTIQGLLGSLVGTSDAIDSYDVESCCELEAIYSKSLVHSIHSPQPNLYTIRFTQNKQQWLAFCNLSTKKMTFAFDNKSIEIDAYDTLIFKA